jgi:hypothetical protein
MRKGVVVREVILMIIAVLLIVTALIILVFLRGRGEEFIEQIRKALSFRWLFE